jgi:hypothetical protein
MSRKASLAAALAFGACACAFARSRTAPALSAEEALLTRRVEGLRKLLVDASSGSLVQVQQVTVIIHQDLVRDLLLAATPFERTVLDRYRLRVDSAAADFSDGFALVRLAGRAELLDGPVSAEVVVLGGLDVVGLGEAGALRCQVRIFAVEARAANVAGLDRPARELIDRFGRDALDALVSDVDVPVRIENRVVIPGIEARRVRIPAAVVPVRARVVDVRVFGERLWVGLAAQVGGRPPAESAS